MKHILTVAALMVTCNAAQAAPIPIDAPKARQMVCVDKIYYAVQKLKRIDKEHLWGPFERKVRVYELSDTTKELKSYDKIPGVEEDFNIVHPLISKAVQYGGTIAGASGYLLGRLNK